MFDVITTETVDSFKFILQDLCENERFVGRKIQHARGRNAPHRQGSAKTYSCFEKRGVILHEIAMSLNVLFP